MPRLTKAARIVALATVLMLGFAALVPATPITFFGEELAPNGTVPPGSDPAQQQAAFLAAVGGLASVESYESFAAGMDMPLGLNFTGPGGNFSATQTGLGATTAVDEVLEGAETDMGGLTRRYPTDGDKYYRSETGFQISFADPITGFGFFGTDVGDFDGQLNIALDNGFSLDLPHTLLTDSNPGGGLIFFGVIDVMSPFSVVTFTIKNNDVTGPNDIMGFDEILASPPSTTPEPTTLALLGLGLAGIGAVARRRLER